MSITIATFQAEWITNQTSKWLTGFLLKFSSISHRIFLWIGIWSLLRIESLLLWYLIKEINGILEAGKSLNNWRDILNRLYIISDGLEKLTGEVMEDPSHSIQWFFSPRLRKKYNQYDAELADIIEAIEIGLDPETHTNIEKAVASIGGN